MKVIQSFKMDCTERELVTGLTHDECVEYIKEHVAKNKNSGELIKVNDNCYGIPWVRFLIKEDTHSIKEYKPRSFVVVTKGTTEQQIKTLTSMYSKDSFVVLEDDPDIDEKRMIFNNK